MKKFLPYEPDESAQVFGIAPLVEKNRYLICGEKDGFLEVVDTVMQKIAFKGQLRSKVDVFDMCKTSYLPNEYAVALGQYGGGLFFITITRKESEDDSNDISF